MKFVDRQFRLRAFHDLREPGMAEYNFVPHEADSPAVDEIHTFGEGLTVEEAAALALDYAKGISAGSNILSVTGGELVIEERELFLGRPHGDWRQIPEDPSYFAVPGFFSRIEDRA